MNRPAYHRLEAFAAHDCTRKIHLPIPDLLPAAVASLIFQCLADSTASLQLPPPSKYIVDMIKRAPYDMILN
jgi:hypothetical protein